MSVPCALLSGPHPPARRAGLTAQRLLAARVVRQGPGHGHEASPAALTGQFPGITLHGHALHRHGARVAHAGLAVADPSFSRLQQTRSGTLRAQAQPQLGQGGPRPQPHLRAALRQGRMHTRTPTPALAERPPAQAEVSEVGPAGGRTTHEFGEPIWSHAGWRRRKGVTGGPGVHSRWQRPQAAGTGPPGPGHSPASVVPLGMEAPGNPGLQAAWLPLTSRRDGPSTGLGQGRPACASPDRLTRTGSGAGAGVLTALGHTDVRVGVEEGLSVGAEAALHQHRALRALGPVRGGGSPGPCTLWTGIHREGAAGLDGLVGCPGHPRGPRWEVRGGRAPRNPGPFWLGPDPRQQAGAHLKSQDAGCTGPHGLYTFSGGQGSSGGRDGVRWAEEARAPPRPPPTHRTARRWRFASRCRRPGRGRAPRRPPGSGRAPRGGRPGRRPGRRR